MALSLGCLFTFIGLEYKLKKTSHRKFAELKNYEVFKIDKLKSVTRIGGSFSLDNFVLKYFRSCFKKVPTDVRSA